MKSAHEILIDDKMARLDRATEEKKWAQIVSSSRTPIWPWLSGVIGWPALAVFVALFDHAKAPTIYYAGPAFFYILSVGQLVSAFKKRENGLLDAIKKDAPDLFLRLKK
jgi:hypothetical protein